MEGKSQIRKELIAKRDSISPDLWSEYSNTIQKKLLKSSIYRTADCIMCYADYNGEVGTLTIIEDALMKGKEVYLPKVLDNFVESRMEFYRIYSTYELIDGYKGIKEPLGTADRAFVSSAFSSKKVLMLVPGVAFDKHNHRLGYGKGFYDNYLKDKDNILKIALCFSMQIQDTVPSTEHDITMDYLLCETTDSTEINKFKY